MTQVTVRAEQRFADWVAGEVRTVARTPLVETLISDGRVTVITSPSATPEQAVEDAEAAVHAAAAAAGSAQAELAETRQDAAELAESVIQGRRALRARRAEQAKE